MNRDRNGPDPAETVPCPAKDAASAIASRDHTGLPDILEHVLTRARRRARVGRAVDGEETFLRRLYMHVFRSPELRAKQEDAFNRCLYEVKTLLKWGEALWPFSRRFAGRYMAVSRTGRGVAAKVAYRTEAGRYRWSTESGHCDALFLERLGMPSPE